MSLRPARAPRLTVLAAAGSTAAALLALSTPVSAAAGPGAAPGAVRLAGSTPSWAVAGADRGRVAAGTPVEFDVVLALRDQAGADAALRAVSTPGNAAYRHAETPAQFQATYAPTAATRAAVRRWASSTGLRVTGGGGMYVQVAGTAAQAGALLGTSLHTYAYRGRQLRATSTDIAVPTALAGAVAGVDGLDDTPAQSQLARDGQATASSTSDTPGTSSTSGTSDGPTRTLPGPPPGNRYGVQPCSAYYGQKTATGEPRAYGAAQPYTICGYDAKQYESAFGYAKAIAAGNDGSGVTVAITDAYAAPTMPGDANIWSAQNGLPTFAKGQYTQVLPDSFDKFALCGPQGWYGEETLDIEAVHAMAPGAKVVYVGGKNCNGGLDNAFASVIDQHLASVVTDSWTYGEVTSEAQTPPGVLDFFHEYLTEAGLTGVSALFSSGDDGDGSDVNDGTPAIEPPASDPYATAVGGTSTEIAKDGRIALQTGWSNDYAKLSADGTSWTPTPPGTYSSGSGGGVSTIYAQPFYQQGVVPNVVSRAGGGAAMRAVPDISMPGDPNTGLRIGETQTFPDGTYYDTFRLGGTSLSAPLLAGVLADTVQATGSELGLINPAIYGTYATTAAVTDVTTVKHVATVRVDYANFLDASAGYLYRLQTLDVPTTISTRNGYDDMTGLGTPAGTAFYRAFRR